MTLRPLAMALALLTVSRANLASTVDLGRGLRSATGDLRQTCVAFTPPQMPFQTADQMVYTAVLPSATTAGKSFTYQLKYLETLESLREALDVSFNASARGMWGSGSASYSYMNSVEVDDYSLSMMIIGKVVGTPVTITATPDSNAIKNLKPAEILQKCGDAFVASVSYGGAIYGTLVINTHSRTERQRIRQALEASFASGIEVNGAVQKTFEHVLRNTQYYIVYSQEGGSYTVGLPSNLSSVQAFFNWARQAEQVIMADPVVMEVKAQPLSSVYPKVKFPSTANQYDALMRLSAQYVEVKARDSALSFIASHGHHFRVADAAKALSVQKEVRRLLRETGFMAENCFRDETLCKAKDVKAIGSQWAKVNVALPSQDPFYEAFDFAQFESKPMSYGRNAGCPERWEWSLNLGDYEISGNNSVLNYAFRCVRTGYCYDCGGGWDCQFAGEVKTWNSNVTADLRVENGDTLRVSNVKSHANLYDGSCEAELVDFINSRDKSKIRP